MYGDVGAAAISLREALSQQCGEEVIVSIGQKEVGVPLIIVYLQGELQQGLTVPSTWEGVEISIRTSSTFPRPKG